MTVLTRKRLAAYRREMRKGLNHSFTDPRVIACKRAIKKVGGYTAMARLFDILPQSVYRWEVVPADRCKDVARATGIDIHTLRPDVFGPKKHKTRHLRKREIRHVDSAAHLTHASPTTEMDGRRTGGGEGAIGARGDGIGGGPRNGHWQERSLGADIPRPGNGTAGLRHQTQGKPAAPADDPSTSTAACGYNRNSW